MEDKSDKDVTPAWRDPKQGGILAAIALASGLLSSAGIQFVDRDNVFTQHDFDREKAALIQYGDYKCQEWAVKAKQEIKSEISAQNRDDMRAIRDEITRNRSRLDQLLESTARLSAIMEQSTIYSRHAKQGDNQ